MPDKPHAAGVMFELADGRALFLERSGDARDHPGKWCWPGGSIDQGEFPKQAARREVLEETGHTVGRLGPAIDDRGGFRTYRVVRGGEFTPVLNDEHTRYVWARPDEAPQPLHPGVAATLDKLARAKTRRPLPAPAMGRPVVALDAKRTITPIRAAAPTRIVYQKRVDALVDEMAKSLLYWLRAQYRAETPATVELAEDASASRLLQAAFDQLRRRWLRKFDILADDLAGWFAGSTYGRVDGALKTDMRKAGFTVKFKMTAAMRDAYNAVVDENVGLIKSIGEQHLAQVQTALSQSVANGRDLAHLASELEKRTGITKRRAAFIARDQNNKATAVMVRTRALELGITKARWAHSAGGKTPRPEHVKAGREGMIFDLAKGHDFNNGEGTVWPGTAINCRCVAIPIVPGFE